MESTVKLEAKNLFLQEQRMCSYRNKFLKVSHSMVALEPVGC